MVKVTKRETFVLDIPGCYEDVILTAGQVRELMLACSDALGITLFNEDGDVLNTMYGRQVDEYVSD